MATVLRVDEHFSAEHIGKALARLHDVDGLTLCLQPRLDEEGQELTCPITLARIFKNAAIIQDGSNHIYQFGWIQRWLTANDRSPMTNCVLPHQNILRLSSLTGVLQCFLGDCSNRRAHSWQQRITKARSTDRGSCEDLEKALLLIESYLTPARHELAKWLQYISDLADEAIALRENLSRCHRREAQAVSRVCLDSAFGAAARSLQLQETNASVIKSIYSKFQAQRHLQEMRASHAAVACIQGCAHTFLAKFVVSSYIAARNRDKVSAQLLKAVRNDLGLIVINTLLQRRAFPDVVGEDCFTPALLALANGRLEVAQLLFGARADIDKADKKGSTLLLVASEEGHAECVQIICGARADIDKSNNNGDTPLHLASQQGHAEVAQLLCHTRADIDKPNKQMSATPLLMASQFGYAEVAQVLCRARADIDKSTDNGGTPLLMASERGHAEVAQFLCRARADIDKCGIDGVAPLFMASQSGHAEVAQLLCGSGADIDKHRSDGVTPLGPYDRLATPLDAASCLGHEEIVQLLCRARADIDKRSADGSTALHTASDYGHAEIVQLLCGARAAIDKRKTDGVTPLLMASLTGHADVAQLLCGARADIDKPANDIATPFVIASQNGHVEVAELLHQAGADVRDITKTP
jgi:ankyrin repeat protein